MNEKNLKPASVFYYFEEICQVPRPSKKRGENNCLFESLR